MMKKYSKKNNISTINADTDIWLHLSLGFSGNCQGFPGRTLHCFNESD